LELFQQCGIFLLDFETQFQQCGIFLLDFETQFQQCGIFLLDFGTVPAVWYFSFRVWNCSSSVVFFF
jgi:hypothetical protein